MKQSLLFFFLSIGLALSAQNNSIKGTVTTKDGQAVPEVAITIESLKAYTQTNEDGHFELTNIKPGTYLLRLTHTGLSPLEQWVTVQSGKSTNLSLLLHETAKQLEEVIVSSSKAYIKTPSLGKAGIANLNNPQSIGIVSNTVIKDQQAMRLGDVLKNVSGVSLTQQRQGVAETFSARGYSIGISGSTGNIFKNGVATNTAGFPEASTLESVEVLKGSSALLYGNTSAGLIVNMVTKKPKFVWGGEVSMSAGSYDLYKPMIDVFGPISSKAAFRVVSTYEKSNSFRDVVQTERKYINPSMLFKLGKKTTVLLQMDYLHTNFTPDNGIGVINQNTDVIIPTSRTRFINTAWAYYTSQTSSASATIDHQLNEKWKMNVIVAGQDVQINSFATALPTNIAVNGDWNRTLSRTGSHETNQTVQTNFIGNVKTGHIKHQLLFGADYIGITTSVNAFRITQGNGLVNINYDKINILNPSLYTPRTDMPSTLDTGRVITPAQRFGIYAQDLVSITSKLKMLIGLRWSYQEVKPVRTLNYIKQTESRGSITTDKAFSPKVALMFEPKANMNIYASYANSFTVNTGTDIYGNALRPSYINQYELGWKQLFFGNKLSTNFSIYRIQNSDLAQMAITLADGSPNTNTTIRELTGQTTSDGFDMDISASFSKNFYFIVGYGFNNARYTGSTGAKGSVVEGEKLNNNPQHTANATVFYTFSNTVLKGLKLGIATFYTGNRFGGNQNTVGQTPAFNRQIALSDFTTIDLTAGYTIKKYSLLVKLSNVTNTLNYLVHDRYSINPIAPRQIMATLNYKF
jgi:iron complex outermembrane receptor protein